MSITNFLEKNKELQEVFLDFIDKQDNIEEHFQNLLEIFQDEKIQDDKHKLKLLLHFVSSIVDDYYRESNFFDKIEKILDNFQEEIKKYYSNKEIFDIFKSNKRILLFLFTTKIINFDQYIYNTITTEEYVKKDYPQYFQSEINSEFNEYKPIQENFEENRKIGQNDAYICKLIQKDSIDEFITYVNKNNISLDSTINRSIYETNSFLIEKTPTLIEYTVFFGSIQIFNYLRLNKVELTSSLWLFAIHGRNPELIHLLEENQIKPEIECDSNKSKNFRNKKKEKIVSYREIFIESIKCHHNEIKNYIEENYLFDENLSFEALIQSIKYYNFCFIDSNLINQSSFHDLCRYDYYNIVEIILNNKEIDINSFKDNKTALLIAVENENIDLIQLLISNEKIDINASCAHKIKYNEYNFGGEYIEEITPFYLAVDKENLDIIKLLLSKKELDINYLNKVVCYDKRIPENVEEVDDDDDNDDYDFSPHDIEDHFYEPIDNGNEYKEPEVTTIKSGQLTSFYHAIEKGNSEIIDLLLKNEEIDFNIMNTIKTETKEFYEKYRRYQNGNIYRWRVKTTKKEEKTAFYLAVEKENLGVIQNLLSLEKVDVNIPNTIETNIDSDKDEYSFGNTDSELETTVETEIKTAFYFVVENENLDILNLLLTNEKINVNIPCKYNEKYDLSCYNCPRKNDEYETEKTAFYLAVEYKNLEILKVLLSNEKIDINNGFKKDEIIKEFKPEEEGEIKSCTNKEIKRTPLHLAVKNQSIEIIKILLNQKNIDLNIKDDEGFKPIELTKNEQIKNLFNK